MNTIVEQLDALAELQSKRDILALNKQAMRDSVLTPEIRAQLEDIELEFAPSFVEVDEKIGSLITEVKTAVLVERATVKGERLMAVWAKGRVGWDTAALDGYIKAHPELADLRKEGEPSVSIRVNK